MDLSSATNSTSMKKRIVLALCIILNNSENFVILEEILTPINKYERFFYDMIRYERTFVTKKKQLNSCILVNQLTFLSAKHKL